jgi:tetratricopeptide (TPR) repeat protein
MQPNRPVPAALQALCDQGRAHHQAGRLDEARRLYDLVLTQDPGNFDALQLSGVLRIQAGRPDEAVALIERAIQVQPDAAFAYGNLASALNSLGRLEEAVRRSGQAIALKPDYAEAHGNRGQALYRLGRLDEALDSYGRVVALKADARSFLNQAVVLRELGRPREALASFDQALALNPDSADAHHGRGVALRELGRLTESVSAFDQAIALRSDHAQAQYDRAAALRELGRPEAALEGYDRALALRPAYPEALGNRANALADLDRLEEALDSYDQALALDPDHVEAHTNRGVLLQRLRRLDEAMESYNRALALRPDDAEANVNQAMCRLTMGDYARGWRQYEARRGARRAEAGRERAGPLWLGDQDLHGRTILLHAEQGLGDVLQFSRYAPLVAERGAQVVLEVYPAVGRLMRRLPGVDQVVEYGSALPAYDLQTPLMSLPLALGAAPGTANAPYLSADPDDVARWAERLGPGGGLKVGLCWAGGVRPDQPVVDAVDKRRSLPLSVLTPLSGVESVRWYSLQKGPPAAEAAGIGNGWSGTPIIDFTAELEDFADTAALVANLDLVIACDTSVAHLAGAIGKPVWILNRFDGCWRWLADRDDTPWYPSARLFTQTAAGDWAGVIERVKGELKGFSPP